MSSAFATRAARLAFFSLLVSLPLVAAPKPDARQILIDSETRHRSHAQQYEGELEVVTHDGTTRTKKWKSYREGYAGDAKHLIRFTHPPEVRGVGYLSLGRPGKPAQQWMYLPSMKRERRVATRDRGASFVGTDFNFEDMEDYDHTEFDVSLEGVVELSGVATYLIEARPRSKSLYLRKLLWVRVSDLFIVQSESFERDREQPWKRLVLSDIEEVDGHEVARKMVMTDLVKERSTTVVLTKVAFDQAQPDDRYTLQNLNREHE